MTHLVFFLEEPSAKELLQGILPKVLPEQCTTQFVVFEGKQVAGEDFFGFAAGKEGERYLGFMLGQKGVVDLDEASLLIQREVAVSYRDRLEQEKNTGTGGAEGSGIRRTEGSSGIRGTDGVGETGPGAAGGIGSSATASGDTGAGGRGSISAGGATGTASGTGDGRYTATGGREGDSSSGQGTPAKTQFYGSIEVDPVKAKMDFAQIVDEIIEQFTARVGVEVTLSIDIQAKSPSGFDESLQRTIKENCCVLKFGSAEFEEGD